MRPCTIRARYMKSGTTCLRLEIGFWYTIIHSGVDSRRRSPTLFMVVILSFTLFAESCFQLPLQVNRIPAAIRRKKKDYDTAATDDDDDQSRDPETHFTFTSSGAASEIESPSFIPIMSVDPPTPTGSTVTSPVREYSSPPSTPERQTFRKSPSLRSCSLNDMSKISANVKSSESESLIKPLASVSPVSKPGNMLYIPEMKGRLSAAVSESSLWNSRNKPWLDGTNMDFRGSTLISSQGLVHPRKTEKVAQVCVFRWIYQLTFLCLEIVPSLQQFSVEWEGSPVCLCFRFASLCGWREKRKRAILTTNQTQNWRNRVQTTQVFPLFGSSTCLHS